MEAQKPGLSVITVCRNNVDTLGFTLESVEAQARAFEGRLQHILIDGNSEDGTWEMIQAYRDRVADVIDVIAEQEEAPRGIYPAMNQGLRKAEGKATNFLNGDDFYPEEPILDEIYNRFESGEADAVFGKIDYVTRGKKEVSKKGKLHGEYKGPEQLIDAWYMPHQAMWADTQKLQDLPFKEQYRIAADTDQCVAFVKNSNPDAIIRIPKTLAYMSEGGVSGRHIVRGIWERSDIYRNHFPEKYSRWNYILSRALKCHKLPRVLANNIRHLIKNGKW